MFWWRSASLTMLRSTPAPDSQDPTVRLKSWMRSLSIPAGISNFATARHSAGVGSRSSFFRNFSTSAGTAGSAS